MKLLPLACRVIGISQLVLGALYLFMPGFFIEMQNLTPIAADTGYPLAMLGARFLVYGVGMFIIANDPVKHMFWLNGMIIIQVIDLAAGVFYVGMGFVPLQHAVAPLFNATLFIVLLNLFRRQTGAAPANA